MKSESASILRKCLEFIISKFTLCRTISAGWKSWWSFGGGPRSCIGLSICLKGKSQWRAGPISLLIPGKRSCRLDCGLDRKSECSNCKGCWTDRSRPYLSKVADIDSPCLGLTDPTEEPLIPVEGSLGWFRIETVLPDLSWTQRPTSNSAGNCYRSTIFILSQCSVVRVESWWAEEPLGTEQPRQYIP